MTYRVIIQARAVRDIWAAAKWIDDQSKSSAKALRWVRGIRARIDTLKANPKRCPVDPDSEAFGMEVRVLLYGKPTGKHRVLFAIQGDTVRVLTVCHSARQSLSEEMGRGEANDEEAAHSIERSNRSLTAFT